MYYILISDKAKILYGNSISTRNYIRKKFNFNKTCLKLSFFSVPTDTVFTGIYKFLVISTLKETSDIALLTASKFSLV